MKKLITGICVSLISVSFACAQLVDQADSAVDCAALTYSLKLGSRDATTRGEVTTLQTYLVQSNLLESDPTGYFGQVTKKAVQAFQSANGISPTGIIGTYSRAKIKALSCTGQASSFLQTVSQVVSQASSPSNQPYVPTWSGVASQVASGVAPIPGQASVTQGVVRPMQVMFRQGSYIGKVNVPISVSWVTPNADKCSLSTAQDGVVSETFKRPNGYYTVQPNQISEKDYVLTCKQLKDGSVSEYDESRTLSARAHVSIVATQAEVNNPAPLAEAQRTPISILFSQSDVTTRVGNSVTLSWTALNADRCTLSSRTDGDMATFTNMSGSYVVTPSQVGVTEYSLSCQQYMAGQTDAINYASNYVRSVRVTATSDAVTPVQSQVATPVTITGFANKEPHPVTGATFIGWNTSANAGVALDMKCAPGSISFVTDKGNAPICEKGGVYMWQGMSSGSIIVTPATNQSAITVPFILTLLSPTGAYTNQQQTIYVTFPKIATTTNSQLNASIGSFATSAPVTTVTPLSTEPVITSVSVTQNIVTVYGKNLYVPGMLYTVNDTPVNKMVTLRADMIAFMMDGNKIINGKNYIGIKYGTSNGAGASFDASPAVQTPLFTLSSNPLLSLAYDSIRRESSLVAKFTVTVSARNSQFVINKNAYLADAANISVYLEGSNPYHSYGDGLMTMSVQSGDAVDTGSSITLPPFKSATLLVTKTFAPRTLFADSYSAKLNFYTTVPIFTSSGSNMVTVVGETGPHIASFAVNGDVVTLSGERLLQPTSGLYINGQPAKALISRTATTITFSQYANGLTAGAATTVMMNDPVLGNSRMHSFVASPVAPPSPTVRIPISPIRSLKMAE